MSVAHYFHSLRHLKPIQIYWRGYVALAPLRGFDVRLSDEPALRVPALVTPVTKHPTWDGDRFRFLNQPVRFEDGIAWNRPDLPKLWLYNLHYFDWVNQPAVDVEAALALTRQWVAQNPPGAGSGWEPYPLSLRLVNWLKFFGRLQEEGKTIDDGLVASLFLQARYLEQHLEYHLLGNHLFKNAVALLWAGACFAGAEAQRWYRRGRQILLDQLEEQILPDGGHFERSVMYHAITLEDVLDCLNLLRAAGGADDPLAHRLAGVGRAMQQFLVDVLHPDGEIPFFNDAAIGIAPRPADLAAYAGRLGLGDVDASPGRVILKPDFGLYVLRHRGASIVFDAGAIGPDYLPGHAHCDTLSFELSLDADRWVVNAGTYGYMAEDRPRYRGTAAHNTVMLDAAEQHEIWASFRVARRGYPEDVRLLGSAGLRAAHSGYRRLPGAPVHVRELQLRPDGIALRDMIEGEGRHAAVSFVHLHPNVVLERVGENSFVGRQGSRRIQFSAEGDRVDVLPYDYAPEFGLKHPAQCIAIRRTGVAPFVLGLRLVF